MTLVRAPDEGQRSEVWMMREDSGEFLAVFKPHRNDVSFVKGEGYLKEPAAWIADALSSSQAGVPATLCVEIKVANTTLEGSAQAFIAEGFDGNDYRYSGGSLHQEGAERLAVSDMRLANSDRNLGNILVIEPKPWTLIPFDHALCLPDWQNLAKLRGMQVAWESWPHSRNAPSRQCLHLLQDAVKTLPQTTMLLALTANARQLAWQRRAMALTVAVLVDWNPTLPSFC